MKKRIFGLLTIALLIAFVQKTRNETPHENVDDRIRLSSANAVTPIIEKQFTALLDQLSTVPEPQSDATLIVTASGKRYMTFHDMRRHPIASLTKLMTAIVAKEYIGNATIIPVSENAVATEGPAGDFAVGEEYNVHDLMAAMIIASSNDAATAIAEYYNPQMLVDLMQQKATMIGMHDTTFFDPTGLSSLNQSTAHDLALLIRYISRYHPDILELSRRKETVIIDQSNGGKRVLKNINEFSGNHNFLGGKTGYTPEAKGNLISLFRIGNDTLLMIVLGAEDRFGETRKLHDWVLKITH